MTYRFNISKDNAKNSLLSDFGVSILQDRYLFKDEDIQDLFVRVSCYYADDESHAQRLYNYMSSMWFMPATPVLANGGTTRGLPISCFLNEAQDSLESINSLWNENVHLASNGGGIGSYFGNIRSINEPIKDKGYTSGIIPFIKVTDSMTLAISQGSLRRGSAAVYLQIDHPEIEEFIDIRRPTGGDANRRCLNIHHGVVITDEFMDAVSTGKAFELKSPHTGLVTGSVSARDLWIKLLNTRVETGEPYMLFIDSVNRAIPKHHQDLGLRVKTSNLCSEITLPTGVDYDNKERTAVCCLSSLNLEYYEQWEQNPDFIPDVMRFLDNVLQDFIDNAPDGMARAKYSAMMERSVGLGVMGFHSFLQSKMIPFESVVAKSWNKRMFKKIKEECDKISVILATEKAPCPDAAKCGIKERFSNKIAIAPTASISVITGNASPGIEPYVANTFTQKTISGSFVVRNKYLVKLLQQKGMDRSEIWSSISTNAGSVQHLDCLTPDEKLIFKTAFEMNQMWLIEHAADRTPYICQAQSLNLFFSSDVDKKHLHITHYEAWKRGVKSLYYCRSRSIQRADNVSGMGDSVIKSDISEVSKYEECVACQ